MPGASATYAPSRSRTGGAAKRTPQRPGVQTAAGRVRWDRLGRIAMLLVLLALVFLYLSAGLHMLSSWKQSSRDNARVSELQSEHRTLLHEHNLLSSQSNLEVQAHQLDMLPPGERPYIVKNLPRN
jgi:hypothetical protein